MCLWVFTIQIVANSQFNDQPQKAKYNEILFRKNILSYVYVMCWSKKKKKRRSLLHNWKEKLTSDLRVIFIKCL